MNVAPVNIRTRLARAYAIAVGLSILVYAIVLYLATRSSLHDQLEARLRDDIERVEHGFEFAMDGSISWIEAEGPFHDIHGRNDVWAEVRTEGQPTLRWPEDQDAPEDVLRLAARYVRGPSVATVTIARSTEPVRRELQGLMFLMAVCGVPCVLGAWGVGHLLARRALAPVDRMVEEARFIGGEDLSRRLPVANPDDELGRLARVFNAAFDRVESSFDRLRQFTGDAAHELRTPLAAIRSVGEVGLSDAKTPEQQREAIASMLEETDRLTRLIDDLLVLARSDTRHSERTLAPSPVALDAIVEAACERLEVLAVERGQTLVVDCEPVELMGDADALRRMVTNVVDNAIRHGPADAEIRVELVCEKPAVALLTITDQGPGIPEAHRSRVFDRFFQADPARAGAGSGLGLAIAAQIAADHAGMIEVRGQRPTRFEIRLGATAAG